MVKLNKILVVAVWVLIGAPLLAQTMTTENGAPVGDDEYSQTAGLNGPILLQDTHLIQKLQKFDRERIPERVVHARGVGAFGEFVSCSDASNLTRASLFAAPGKVTPVFVRFSVVIHPKGSPETLRDVRGFATKFYTDQGNWNLVCNNLPVFFIRDPLKFPDVVHAFKPSPVTNVQDPNRIFDFLSHQPESTFLVTMIFSDLGIPASYRTMDGHSVNAFKFVNSAGRVQYVKFHWKSCQALKTLTSTQAAQKQGEDFNNLTNDLYGALKRDEHPKWDLYVQVLDPQDFDRFTFDPLDDTKVWPGIPERKLGTMTLNKIPDNYFETTEQAAFPVSDLVPGIEPSEDRILQARLFAMQDTAFHRLGTNFQQIPINRPLVPVLNYSQDGQGDQKKREGEVNYQPSISRCTYLANPQDRPVQTPLVGTTQQKRIAKAENFKQAGVFYRSLNKKGRDNLIENLGGALKAVRDEGVRQTMLSFCYKADSDYGRRLTKEVGGNLDDVKKRAALLSDD